MAESPQEHRTPADWPFFLALSVLGGAYLLLIAAMLTADAAFTSPSHIWQALGSPAIRYSIWLSLLSCSITAILSVWVAVPLGYLLSRFDFPGRRLIDVLIDIPIVLPPLVVGLSLLILFQTPLGRFINSIVSVTYAIPSVILAQFSVACAFAVRTMRGTFDQIPRRQEQVAMTLGCSRGQAFWRVTLPQARRGVVAAFTLAWARSLGEFGPILVFSGATRFRTEVLSTTVFLELSVGNLEAAIAVSLLMVAAAVVVLVIVQVIGAEKVLAQGYNHRKRFSVAVGRNKVMPMHDWTLVEASIFHVFHQRWISAISDTLNVGLLPTDYYALAEQVAAGFEPDVLTLQDQRPDAADETAGGGVATTARLQARPQTRFTAETDMEFYRRKKNAIAVRHVSGDRLVAMIEILSPGNKSSRKAFRAFVDKAWKLLEHRIHLLLIDPFPPGPRDPNGVHAAIWAEVQDDSFVLPADKTLTLAAYECDVVTRAYIEPIAVGDVLPNMPLFLEPNGCVQVPLEATYQTAFAVMPRRWRDELQPPDGG